MGGNFLLKLNIVPRPIANKYCEGKVKRTLKRELKVREIAIWEANETSSCTQDCLRRGLMSVDTLRVFAVLKPDILDVSCVLCQCALDVYGSRWNIYDSLLCFVVSALTFTLM